jgi:hypothetical protein
MGEVKVDGTDELLAADLSLGIFTVHVEQLAHLPSQSFGHYPCDWRSVQFLAGIPRDTGRIGAGAGRFVSLQERRAGARLSRRVRWRGAIATKIGPFSRMRSPTTRSARRSGGVNGLGSLLGRSQYGGPFVSSHRRWTNVVQSGYRGEVA